MLQKYNCSKPEVLLSAQWPILELLCTGEWREIQNIVSIASQTGLPGSGGEWGRPVHWEVVVKRPSSEVGFSADNLVWIYSQSLRMPISNEHDKLQSPRMSWLFGRIWNWFAMDKSIYVLSVSE
jgi:hypothetical protein